MGKDYDPEVEAYERGMVICERYDLPAGLRAATDCEDIIWIDARLLGAERRSSLAHEVAHCEIYAENPGRMGGGGQRVCRSVENECDERAAVKLIDFEELLDAVKWADSIEEAAWELHVTQRMIRARLRTLSKDEVKRFDHHVGRGYAARLRGKPLKRTPLKR